MEGAWFDSRQRMMICAHLRRVAVNHNLLPKQLMCFDRHFPDFCIGSKIGHDCVDRLIATQNHCAVSDLKPMAGAPDSRQHDVRCFKGRNKICLVRSLGQSTAVRRCTLVRMIDDHRPVIPSADWSRGPADWAPVAAAVIVDFHFLNFKISLPAG